MDIIDADDAANALSPWVLLEIFDDENTGDVDTVKASEALLLDVALANAEVTSWIKTEYAVPLTDPGPDPLLKAAALMFFKACARAKHPSSTSALRS